MASVGYNCTTEGAVALVAATAKTINGVKAHANSGLQVVKWRVSFDGVTASAVPVFCELCYCTWATNSPGTASTSTTPKQTYGRVLTAGFTSGKTWTTEPTTLTMFENFDLSPNGGVAFIENSLGTFPDCALAEGFAIRCTAPAGVNVRALLAVERI